MRLFDEHGNVNDWAILVGMAIIIGIMYILFVGFPDLAAIGVCANRGC